MRAQSRVTVPKRTWSKGPSPLGPIPVVRTKLEANRKDWKVCAEKDQGVGFGQTAVSLCLHMINDVCVSMYT